MKILHYTLGKVNPDSSNGINKVISGLAKYGNKTDGVQVDVLTWRSKQHGNHETFQRDGFAVDAYRRFIDVVLVLIKKANTYDIVHLHNAWNVSNDVIARILATKNIPYCITIHAGLAQDRVKGSHYIKKIIYHNLIQKGTLKKAALIQALSEDEIQEIKRYTSNNNIIMLPNGIDMDLIKQKEITKDNKKTIFGYLGRFGEEKNIDELIKSLKYIDQTNLEKIEIWLAGPLDDDAKKLIKLTSNYGLQNNIKFLGAKYGNAKNEYFMTIDVLVHPALSEGCSISILEAMSYGLPIVASRTSSIANLYKYDFFEMVEPSASEIAKGIVHILSRKNEWSEMGGRGRELINGFLNWNVISSRLLTEYEKCIN